MALDPKFLIEVTIPRWIEELDEIQADFHDDMPITAHIELSSVIRDMKDTLELSKEDSDVE